MNRLLLGRTLILLAALSLPVAAWDHPGHMAGAAIAFEEIQRERPELVEKIGLLLLTHPDPAPFAVAAGETKGTERFRQMFIECSRWPDDARFTLHDRPAWHTTRRPVMAPDAPPAARAAAEARGGAPMGQAVEALALNYGVLANPEAKPAERATALCWVLHVVGDIHQPLHTADLFSADYPAGNAAGTLAYVEDPVTGSALPLHLLWDSYTLRSTEAEHIDQAMRDYVKAHPRQQLDELAAFSGPEDFETWAQESFAIARDFAYAGQLETAQDPDQSMDADRLVKNMIKFIVEGISPLDSAPKVPAEYWAEVQRVSARRVTLSGYRMADLIMHAADRIALQREAVRVP